MKTLQDRPRLLRTRTMRVAELGELSKPAQLSTTRLAEERRVYTVEAQLVGFKSEEDGDIHAVIAEPDEGAKTMIIEFPLLSCADHATPYRRRQIARAREAFATAFGTASSRFKRRSVPVRVTGVLFFDFLHGQIGVAPNGAELHPVLSFELR